MRNDLSLVITLILLGIALMMILRIFWPVLVVMAVMILVMVLVNKHELKKAEKQAAKEQEDLETQLFKEQVARKKRENVEIIEAEFVEKEDNQYDRH